MDMSPKNWNIWLKPFNLNKKIDMSQTTQYKSSIGWVGSLVFLLISLWLLVDATHSKSDFRTFFAGFLVLFFCLTLFYTLSDKD